MRLPRIQFNRYSPFSLNGHFHKTVISLNWTPGVGPAVPQSLFWLSIKADKILKCWSPQCWVILDVKTCEVFLCFLAIIFLGSIVLTSHWLLCINCFTSLVRYTGSYREYEPQCSSKNSKAHDAKHLNTIYHKPLSYKRLINIFFYTNAKDGN